VTEDEAAAERMLTDVVAKMVGRPPEALRERVLIGTPESCAAKLAALRAAGAQEVLLWPVADELRQAEVFMKSVVPLAR
jgi:alkanesulfonate monooxygenase SsuD/methylene tetrahydromethanopterin reductase-like flavin-dependent oxidoreductase (luciferase family)